MAENGRVGDRHDGVLLPGDDTEIPLHSDTSGSIIIILNSELPGSIVFSVRTPTGQVVDPASAAGLGVGYITYSEGEGQVVQSYHFSAADQGDYTALLVGTRANGAPWGTCPEIEEGVIDEGDTDGDAEEPAGTVLAGEAGTLMVSTGEGVLHIDELQAAGGKRLTCREFLNARSLPPGTRLRAAEEG